MIYTQNDFDKVVCACWTTPTWNKNNTNCNYKWLCADRPFCEFHYQRYTGEKQQRVKRLKQCAPADTGNDPNCSLQPSGEKVTCGVQTAVNDESARKWIGAQRRSLLRLVCTAMLQAVAWQQKCWFTSKLAAKLNPVTYSQLQSLHPNRLRALISAEGWTSLWFQLDVLGLEWSELIFYTHSSTGVVLCFHSHFQLLFTLSLSASSAALVGFCLKSNVELLCLSQF